MKKERNLQGEGVQVKRRECVAREQPKFSGLDEGVRADVEAL